MPAGKRPMQPWSHQGQEEGLRYPCPSWCIIPRDGAGIYKLQQLFLFLSLSGSEGDRGRVAFVCRRKSVPISIQAVNSLIHRLVSFLYVRIHCRRSHASAR